VFFGGQRGGDSTSRAKEINKPGMQTKGLCR
jgi:hypothetical protein